MIKIRVVQSGQPATEHAIDGNELTIGRSSRQSVVVRNPLVSNRHLRVLHGIVVVDEGSSNGTFLDGKRIEGPTLVGGGKLTLGSDKVHLQIEAAGAGTQEIANPPGTPPTPAPGAGAEALLVENQQLRQRIMLLETQVATGKSSPQAADLQRECDELRAKLQTAEEKARRQKDDPPSVAVKVDSSSGNPMSSMFAEIQRKNLELSRQLAGAQEELSQVKRGGESSLVDTLRAQKEALQRELVDLKSGRGGLGPRAAGANVPEPADGGSPLLAQLQAQCSKLRMRVQELEAGVGGAPSAGAPAPGSAAASEMFQRLQAENSALQGRVRQLEVSAATGTAGGGSPATVEFLQKLQNENAALRQDLERMRLAQPPVAQTPGVGGLGAAFPGAQPAAGVAQGPSSGASMGLLRRLLDEGFDAHPPRNDGPVDEFFVLEFFRFLRKVERVVTYKANEFMELYQLQTIVPGVEGNFCGLAAEVLQSPGDAGCRHRLIHYLGEVGQWLVVELGAYQKAASEFGLFVREELTEAGLLKRYPISGAKRLIGGRDADLWKRVQQFLQEEMGDSIVRDKVESLAREYARAQIKPGT